MPICRAAISEPREAVSPHRFDRVKTSPTSLEYNVNYGKTGPVYASRSRSWTQRPGRSVFVPPSSLVVRRGES